MRIRISNTKKDPDWSTFFSLSPSSVSSLPVSASPSIKIWALFGHQLSYTVTIPVKIRYGTVEEAKYALFGAAPSRKTWLKTFLSIVPFSQVSLLTPKIDHANCHQISLNYFLVNVCCISPHPCCCEKFRIRTFLAYLSTVRVHGSKTATSKVIFQMLCES
jgi:hypothetical protein